MIVYHGTTESRAKDIVENGWFTNAVFYASVHKNYAVGYSRRTWVSSNQPSDKPVLLVIETESDNLLMTNLTLTNGEVIIKDSNKIKIIKVEAIE